MCPTNRNNGTHIDNELTKEEKLLLEEYKVGSDAYHRSEAIYASREYFLIVAESIFIAATVQLLLSKSILWFIVIFIVISIGGISLSLFWFFMQQKSYRVSKGKLNRLKEIENTLSSDKKSERHVFVFFTRSESLREVDITGPESPRDGDKMWYKSTWRIRKYLPCLFIALYIINIILIISIHLCTWYCQKIQ
jgi:hypothetical protein